MSCVRRQHGDGGGLYVLHEKGGKPRVVQLAVKQASNAASRYTGTLTNFQRPLKTIAHAIEQVIEIVLGICSHKTSDQSPVACSPGRCTPAPADSLISGGQQNFLVQKKRIDEDKVAPSAHMPQSLSRFLSSSSRLESSQVC